MPDPTLVVGAIHAVVVPVVDFVQGLVAQGRSVANWLPLLAVAVIVGMVEVVGFAPVGCWSKKKELYFAYCATGNFLPHYPPSVTMIRC